MDDYNQMFDEVYQKVHGTSDPNAPTPAPNTPTPAQSATDDQGRKLDRSQIAEQEEKQQGTEQSPSFGDYAWDGAVGVAAGVEGFGKSIGKLTNDVAGLFGAKFTDDSTFDQSIHTKTWVGGLTSGLTQFALAFLPGIGIAGRVGEAVGITSKLAQGLAAGGIADFIGFDEKQQRLSNLVESVPMLKNPITNFLESKPDDTWAEGRLKNALEGAGMGLIMHPFMEALKGFKGQLAAKLAGNSEEALRVQKATAQKVADAMEGINKSAEAAKVSQSAGMSAEGVGKLNPTAADMAKKSLNDPEVDALAKKVVDHITTSDKPYDVALDEAVATHVNYDRLATSKEVEGLQRFSTKIADDYVQRITNGTVSVKLVEDTAQQLADVFGENPKLLTAAAASDTQAISGVGVRLVSYRIMRNTIGQAMVNAADRIASGVAEDGASEMTRLTTLSKEYMTLHKQVQFIQKEGARIPSFGRALAMTSDEFDPDKLADQIEKTMAGSNGKVAQQQLVRTIIGTKADPKSMVTLFDGMLKQAGGKAAGVVNELHTNAILSSLTTMSTKFLSDLTNAVVLPTERILGGAWQQNRAVMQSGGRMFLNIMQSFMDWTGMGGMANNISDKYGSSLGRAYQAFLKGQPLMDHLTEFEPRQPAITATNVGLSDASLAGHAVNYLGSVVRLPQKFLVGLDEFWKSVNYKAYIRDEGIRLAQQAGLKDPNEFAQFVNNHITQSFSEGGAATNAAGLDYAKMATFQNDLLPGTIGKWIQQGVNDHPALRMIMPFVKTPTNIFRRAWQMTPGLNMLQDEFRQMLMHPDETVRAQALGRMSLGGMLWTLGVGMAATGKLTGGGPSNPEERNAQLEAGWQPYSVVTTDDKGNKQYISFKKMEPFAYFLGLVADWKEAIGQMHDDDAGKMGQAMLYALAHNLTSKTYLTGLTETINALAAPDKNMQRLVNGFAGSFVPAALAKADSDDYMREARTMMDAIMRRIPGLSDSLPPTRNIMGESVRTPQGYLPFGAEGTVAARMVSPFAYSQQVNDKAKQELADLQYGFRKAPRSYQRFDLSMFHNQQGQDAYDRFQELHGQVKIGGKTMGDSINDLISSERYQRMAKPQMHGDDTNPRVQAVNQIIGAYREHAMAQTLREFPGIQRSIQAYSNQNRSVPLSPALSALATR